MPSLPKCGPLLVCALAAVGAAAVPACRCGAGGAEQAAGGSPGDAASSTMEAASDEHEDEDGGDARIGDGSRFRDAEPRVEIDPDGPVDPACTGAEIAFAAAVVDARCAIGSSRAKQLRGTLERPDAALALAQEATVTSDGSVLVRLVNTGTSPLILPLSFHAKLPAFTALAEDEHHAIYELEPPRLQGAAGLDGGPGYGPSPRRPGDRALPPGTTKDEAFGDRPHFARIVLPPRGVALARVRVSPAVVRVIARRTGDRCLDGGADGGACVVTTLPKGRYILHIGELLTDVEVGAPARVTWDVP